MWSRRGGGIGLLILTFALAAGLSAWAQEGAPEEAPATEGAFFGFGGPWVGGVALDLSSLNAALSAQGWPALSENLIAFGGGGMAGTLHGLRWGGGGGGGELHARDGGRSVRLRLGWGGMSVSYGLYADARFDLAVGALVGGGNARLELTYRSAEDFEDAIATPLSTALTRELFVLQPRLELGLTLAPWLSLRATGGYFYAFGGDWKAEGLDLPGPPANFSGWSASLGFKFGSSKGAEKSDEDR